MGNISKSEKIVVKNEKPGLSFRNPKNAKATLIVSSGLQHRPKLIRKKSPNLTSHQQYIESSKIKAIVDEMTKKLCFARQRNNSLEEKLSRVEKERESLRINAKENGELSERVKELREEKKKMQIKLVLQSVKMEKVFGKGVSVSTRTKGTQTSRRQSISIVRKNSNSMKYEESPRVGKNVRNSLLKDFKNLFSVKGNTKKSNNDKQKKKARRKMQISRPKNFSHTFHVGSDGVDEGEKFMKFLSLQSPAVKVDEKEVDEKRKSKWSYVSTNVKRKSWEKQFLEEKMKAEKKNEAIERKVKEQMERKEENVIKKIEEEEEDAFEEEECTFDQKEVPDEFSYDGNEDEDEDGGEIPLPLPGDDINDFMGSKEEVKEKRKKVTKKIVSKKVDVLKDQNNSSKKGVGEMLRESFYLLKNGMNSRRKNMNYRVSKELYEERETKQNKKLKKKKTFESKM